MPAYEYQCDACAKHFEIRQKMSDPVLESCPECGQSLRRLISGGAGAITRGAHSASSQSGSYSGCAADACCLGEREDSACCGGRFCEN